jgi:hypothetical protein
MLILIAVLLYLLAGFLSFFVGLLFNQDADKEDQLSNLFLFLLSLIWPLVSCVVLYHILSTFKHKNKFK